MALFASAMCLGGAEPKPVASYDIRATLDTVNRTIQGTQTLTWVNDSPDVVATLQFHLYLNAFKNENSTFYKGSGGQLRDIFHDKLSWGYIDVTRIQLDSGADLSGRMRFIQPDDRNRDDQTVIEVSLPAPVGPGGLLRVQMDFTSKLPKVYARTGYHGTFHLAGQWFPKLGVWETAGFRGRAEAGWNCHQFHANSEFYANFGNYRVTLTVPRQFVVGATGEEKSRVVDENAGTATHAFEQVMVTDFAFTAQPDFVRLEREFVPERDVPQAERAEVAQLLGLPESALALPRTRMIVLLQPEHRDQAERQFRALKTGLKWYGLLYGAYPHRTITLVDPPYGGEGAGGMEYPTFITGGTNWREPKDNFFSDETVVHEFGHQYFKELLASNEFEEPWLDEGLTQYATTKIMDREYGPSRIELSFLGLNLSNWLRLPLMRHWSGNRMGYLRGPVLDDLQRFSWEYFSSSSYGINSYSRAAVTLRTLERVLGLEVMARGMRAYFERWRFGHPSGRDFQAVMEEVSGRKLDWFFDQFVFGNRLLDYRVGNVESRDVGESLGVFDGEEGQERYTRTERKDSGKPPMYESTVSIRRIGDAQVPVHVTIRFADGHEEEREWDGQYRWVRYTFLRPQKITWVQVDPGRRYELDVSFANNSWQAERQTRALTHWGGTLVFWLQNLMVWTGALV
jgi:hypothetical protein